jgi:hypothetical protein
MNTSAPLQKLEDITIRALAPVIPMKPVPFENDKPKRKVSKARLEKRTPLFYDKPIYKSKKYDLL